MDILLSINLGRDKLQHRKRGSLGPGLYVMRALVEGVESRQLPQWGRQAGRYPGRHQEQLLGEGPGSVGSQRS